MPIHAVLAGPTASGKTALAIRWATHLSKTRKVAIVSADSRQLYRDFEVGTGTPTAAEQGGIDHHLLGVLDPRELYAPRRFREAADVIVAAHPDTTFLVVGGTGLYLREWMYPGAEERGEIPREIREAALARIAAAQLTDEGLAAVHAELSILDPVGMHRVDPNDTYRITKRLENWLHTGRSYALPKPEQPLNPSFEGVPFLWLEPDRKELHRRIEARAHAMFANGWIEEVKRLKETFDPLRTPAFNAIGYREIADALARGKDPALVIGTVIARTRQYAKKQMTFFRHQFPRAQAWEPAELTAALEGADWDAHALPLKPSPTPILATTESPFESTT
jgi:tRNA dimethylallyltransferase